MKDNKHFCDKNDFMLPDESFNHKHNSIGTLGFIKQDGLSHTAITKFYVTFNSPLSHLDGKQVVFGRVI